jgi:hypothetical protein
MTVRPLLQSPLGATVDQSQMGRYSFTGYHLTAVDAILAMW